MDLYFKGAYINEQETTGGGADAGNHHACRLYKENRNTGGGPRAGTDGAGADDVKQSGRADQPH